MRDTLRITEFGRKDRNKITVAWRERVAAAKQRGRELHEGKTAAGAGRYSATRRSSAAGGAAAFTGAAM